MKRFLIILSMFIFTTDSFASGIGTTPTAPCDNATLSKYTGTVNAEINWEPNEIQLGWYDGNTKLDVPVSAQSCTYDGMITVPPQPTKLGYTFNGWKVIGLPSEYTKLEYIRSDGHAYINTGIVPTQNTRIEVVAKQDPGTGNINIAGSGYGTSGSTTDAVFVLNNGYTTDEYEVKFSTSENWHLIPYNTTLKNTLSLSMTEFKINGMVFLTNNVPLPNSGLQPFYLFQRYRPSITSGVNDMVQIYSFEILDNEVSVLKFIPARRNSDNVVGMYDIIGRQFFTAFDTGSFIAGPVAQ